MEEGDQKHEMEPLKICFCKDCKTLDYAGKKCLKCGSLRVVEASMDFLSFRNITHLEQHFYVRDITKFSENVDYCAN